MRPTTERLLVLAGGLSLAASLCVANLAAAPASRTFFVDASGGNDRRDGLSAKKAWRSIARVNRARLAPGDRVRFRRGGLWRETLRVQSSGRAERPIVFDAYGAGARPVLCGADGVDGWRASGRAGLWWSSLQWQPAQAFEDGRRLPHVEWASDLEKTAAAMATASWSFDVARARLYVRTSDGGTPAGRVMQATRRAVALDGDGSDFIHVHDLALTMAQEDGLTTDGGDGWRVRGVLAAHNGRYGLHAGGGSTAIVFERSEARHNGIGIGGHQTSHLTIRENRITGSADIDNSDGIAVSWSDHVLVEANHVRGNVNGGSADGIQCAGCQGVDVRRNVVTDNSNAGIILTLSREPSFGAIRRNVVAGAKLGISLMVDAGLTEVSNNTVWNEREAGIKLSQLRGDARVAIWNNVVCAASSSSVVLSVPTAFTARVQLDHNYYQRRGKHLVRWGERSFTKLANYRMASSQDAHSRAGDPLFVDVAAGDFRLRRRSPCLDAGRDLNAVSDAVSGVVPDADGRAAVTDGNGDGVARVDIGAYEAEP